MLQNRALNKFPVLTLVSTRNKLTRLMIEENLIAPEVGFENGHEIGGMSKDIFEFDGISRKNVLNTEL
jgi:hypothetical protein